MRQQPSDGDRRAQQFPAYVARLRGRRAHPDCYFRCAVQGKALAARLKWQHLQEQSIFPLFLSSFLFFFSEFACPDEVNPLMARPPGGWLLRVRDHQRPTMISRWILLSTTYMCRDSSDAFTLMNALFFK